MNTTQLKTELANRKLTQREVARRLSFTEQYVNMLVNGHKDWHVRTIRAFSVATGIPIKTLAECLGERYQSEVSRALELEAIAGGVA